MNDDRFELETDQIEKFNEKIVENLWTLVAGKIKGVMNGLG